MRSCVGGEGGGEGEMGQRWVWWVVVDGGWVEEWVKKARARGIQRSRVRTNQTERSYEYLEWIETKQNMKKGKQSGPEI